MTYGCYNTLSSGYLNVISGNYSNIHGGSCNTISSDYSTILGGSCNVIPNTYQYVGVSGCNVTAVLGCAFHANEFVAQNMPLASGTSSYTPSGSAIKIDAPTVPVGLPAGALYYYPIAGVGSPCVVFIK